MTADTTKASADTSTTAGPEPAPFSPPTGLEEEEEEVEEECVSALQLVGG